MTTRVRPTVWTNAASLSGSARIAARTAGSACGRRAASCELRGRGSVGLGEDDVERDHRCPRSAELLDQPADLGARPRPLPDPADRFLVDRHDLHRRVALGSRCGALVAVEEQVTDPRDRRDADNLQREDREQDQRSGQEWAGPEAFEPDTFGQAHLARQRALVLIGLGPPDGEADGVGAEVGAVRGAGFGAARPWPKPGFWGGPKGISGTPDDRPFCWGRS